MAAQVRQLGVEEHIRIERNLLDDVGNAIATKLAVNVALLSSVAGLIRTTPLVDRRSFGVFHASIAADSSSLEGIQGIGFARWLSAAELPAFERRIRAEGFTSFRVRPAGRRPELSAIEFLEPFDWRNRRSFGFDMHSEPTRRQAMERAVRSGLASLSGRVRLLQETPSDVQAGVVLYLPVFEENPARLSGDDRPERLLGWAYSPLRVRDLIRSTLVGVNNPDLGDSRVVVYDGRATVEANLLFDNEASLSRGSRQPLTHPSFRELELVGHTWTVGIQLGPHLIGPSGISSEFWVVLLGGITVSSLLAMASRLLVVSHLATRRALAASEAASQERALASTVFEASSLAIVVTNPDGFILTANNAFTLLSGYRLSEIVGQRTNLLKSGRHDGDFYAAMWDTLLGKGCWEGDLWNKVRNGELRLHHLAISSVRDEQLHTRYYVGMLEDITDRHAAEQAVRFQALHDTLTGLANRSLLMEQLEREVALGHRHNRNFGLLYIDLDGFKPVNDRLGHAAGDCLLSQVAERLRHGSRESDIICRQGGDEFVVLLPQAGSLADLHSHGAKLLALLQEPFELQSSTVRINASFGIARFPDHGPSADALLQAADAAMYGAKTAGGGQVRDASAGPA
ncbi:MAG: CHASE domain-containing protein [Cyanobacteriota bacterium]